MIVELKRSYLAECPGCSISSSETNVDKLKMNKKRLKATVWLHKP